MKKEKEDFIVVFDMDETLGHFLQLNIFWSILKEYYVENNYKYNKTDLFKLIDTFNLFLRPQIIEILNDALPSNIKVGMYITHANGAGVKLQNARGDFSKMIKSIRKSDGSIDLAFSFKLILSKLFKPFIFIWSLSVPFLNLLRKVYSDNILP